MLTKVRNACYCDCEIKEAKKLHKLMKKEKQTQRKGQIKYEGESSEEGDMDEEEEGKDDEEGENQCACVCHGAYSDRVVENEDGSELTFKK
jgi:hypothetical protein